MKKQWFLGSERGVRIRAGILWERRVLVSRPRQDEEKKREIRDLGQVGVNDVEGQGVKDVPGEVHGLSEQGEELLGFLELVESNHKVGGQYGEHGAVVVAANVEVVARVDNSTIAGAADVGDRPASTAPGLFPVAGEVASSLDHLGDTRQPFVSRGTIEGISGEAIFDGPGTGLAAVVKENTAQLLLVLVDTVETGEAVDVCLVGHTRIHVRGKR
jgi:hypothetical protein